MASEDDEIEKAALVHTERGLGRELTTQTTGAPVAAAGQTAADWFGPLQPMRPTAPPDVAGRTRDFQTGTNLLVQPRAEESVPFVTLRALADNCDILRLVIERRKDQITRLPWCVRVRHDGNGARPKASALSAHHRAQIREVTQRLRAPSWQLSFRSWVRSLLEDMLVLDAPTLHIKRNTFGGIADLTVIDGSTIRPIIDAHGQRPRPFLYSGGSIEWLGQTIDPAQMADQGFERVGNFIYPPAYTQVLKGMPAVHYTTNSLIYRPQNPRPQTGYGFSPTEQVMVTARIATGRAFSQLSYLSEGNQPDAIVTMPASWTPDNIQRFQDYFDSLHSGNLAERRRLKFMPEGKYQELKEPPLKSEFDEWLWRIIALAFSYPHSALVKQQNRATSEQSERTAEEEGLEPTKQWLADLLNEIIADFFDAPDLEFAWLEEDEVDQEKQATILSKYVSDGILTPNEARQRLGEEPDPSPAANMLGIKTATGRAPLDHVNATAEATDLKADADKAWRGLSLEKIAVKLKDTRP
ncbi:phage portal protein [Bradyrhizobium jicamae]|uniref:phage portal protein n=1 Tax=Bradyrhizobium jicamae TaxID=280332 RepID=UPI001BA4D664|nr:phage portal protein [Bradyrhizobium jicamae]MBR0934859.1 phage portal protein [Bradyrhizobium jicamae]